MTEEISSVINQRADLIGHVTSYLIQHTAVISVH